MQDLDPSDISTKNFSNPLKRIRVITRTPTHGRTDRQTDRRTDGRTDGRTDEQGESSIPPLNFVSGGITKEFALLTLTPICLSKFSFESIRTPRSFSSFEIVKGTPPIVYVYGRTTCYSDSGQEDFEDVVKDWICLCNTSHASRFNYIISELTYVRCCHLS